MRMNIKTVTDNGRILVSTVDTYDRGLETLVFQADPGTNTINYLEIDGATYSSDSVAMEGHWDLFRKWNEMSDDQITKFVVDRFGPGELLLPTASLHELAKMDSREVYVEDEPNPNDAWYDTSEELN